MPEYWELSEGTYDKSKTKKLTDGKIWEMFSKIFDPSFSVKTSSYKYALVYSIIKNIERDPGSTGFSFDELFADFAEVYWKLIVHKGLYQMSGKRLSSIYQILIGYLLENPTARELSFAEINEKEKKKLLAEIKERCSRNVFGALFGDSDEVFYSFNKKKEGYITLNPKIQDFLKRFGDSILKMDFYQWAKFLSEINPQKIININIFEE